MTGRKPRRQNNNTNSNNHPQSYNHNHRRHLSQGAPQPSDYESDFQNYFSDTQQLPDQQESSMPPSLRTNEELNLSVLRRHNPAITSILSLAQYSVVYIFSPSSRQWEKNGIEGSLFVCQLTQGTLGEERYCVFVLNRRGLNNFDLLLTDGDNVEITEEYIILKSDYNPDNLDTGGAAGDYNNNNNSGNGTNGSSKPGNNNTNVRIYGLWIYSEPPPNSTAETRTINAQMIRECATHAGQSMRLARERLEATHQNGLHVAAAAASVTAPPLQEVQSSVPMGRQISLKDLFGQQRTQDDEWSVRAHQLGPGEWQQPPPVGMPSAGAAPAPQQDVLGDLFRRAGLAYQGGQ
ncbi:decapping enzyme Dcp1 [Aspergillus sclerotioniger CBS 115572]|uniref:Decapping enzyme Dcp1 n=1 Tax=Aspergillus sclerotioniger CBS 115572 TaxID=1450535 RepID=A0A317X1L9_9EURO|nr:decapping enzyme Dcp1 [Aspergillus sclerotioniger CBS 115572]PWY91447.1 decapping enzyme Dcp1 [Aspergillus sclerotioniger CBS 115572]